MGLLSSPDLDSSSHGCVASRARRLSGEQLRRFDSSGGSDPTGSCRSLPRHPPQGLLLGVQAPCTGGICLQSPDRDKVTPVLVDSVIAELTANGGRTVFLWQNAHRFLWSLSDFGVAKIARNLVYTCAVPGVYLSPNFTSAIFVAGTRYSGSNLRSAVAPAIHVLGSCAKIPGPIWAYRYYHEQ